MLVSRKIVFLLLLLIVVTGAFAVQAQDEPITLTFSHFWTDTTEGSGLVVQTQLDKFLAENPNVTVTLETMSHDEYYIKFRVLAASDELPDIFIMNADMTTPLSNAGQLEDLTDDLNADPEWRDLQNPGGMFEWTRNGRVYGLPAQMIITHVIYWNKDIFNEVGIEEFPTDWEGFKDAVVKIREAGYIPIALGSKAGWPLFDCFFGTLSFRGTGLDWYNRLLAHEASFTDPEFITALNAFKELVDIGALNQDATSLDSSQANSLYFTGQAAMVIQGNWNVLGVVMNATDEVKAATGLALWPTIPGGLGQANEVTWAAGWGWALNSRLEGARREAAVKLLKMLSNADYARMRFEGGELSAQPVTDYDETKVSPLFAELNTLSMGWEPVPILTLQFPPSVTDVIWKGLQEIITGQSTPEDVAAKIQAEYDQYKE